MKRMKSIMIVAGITIISISGASLAWAACTNTKPSSDNSSTACKNCSDNTTRSGSCSYTTVNALTLCQCETSSTCTDSSTTANVIIKSYNGTCEGGSCANGKLSSETSGTGKVQTGGTCPTG